MRCYAIMRLTSVIDYYVHQSVSWAVSIISYASNEENNNNTRASQTHAC